MFPYARLITILGRGLNQLQFSQIEIYSGNVNVALYKKVIVKDLLPGSNANYCVDGVILDGKITATKKMDMPTITIDLGSKYRITSISLYIPANITLNNLQVLYNDFSSALPPQIRGKYTFEIIEYHNLNYEKMDESLAWRIIWDTKISHVADGSPGRYRFVSRGNASDRDLLFVAPFFTNPEQVVKVTSIPERKSFCLDNPNYLSCKGICQATDTDEYCIKYNGKLCRDMIGSTKYCQDYVMANNKIIDGKPYCKDIYELSSLPMCKGLYPKNSDCPSSNCQVSKDLYETACKDSRDEKCGCINHKLLAENREKALKQYLGEPLNRINKDIDLAISLARQRGDVGSVRKLEEMRPIALNKVKEYFYFVSHNYLPVSSQCIIDDCRDGKLPVTNACKLTTFISAVCLNSINITQLLGGRITFGGTQSCKQTINIGGCDRNNRCGGGLECINGQCKIKCKDGNCPSGYECINGHCDKNEESEGFNMQWIIIIFIIIIVVIFIAMYKF